MPVLLNKDSNTPTYITDAKQIFLAFFSADKYNDYFEFGNNHGTVSKTIFVRCKVFNFYTSGFTTIYTVKIDNPRKNLYDKHFVLSRFEFNSLPRIYEYKFLKIRSDMGIDDSDKNKRHIYNKTLVLKTIDLFSRLSEIYSKCNVNSKIWYLIITALIRQTNQIHSSNLWLYGFLLEEQESQCLIRDTINKSSFGLVSINSSQLWPLKYLKKYGYEQLFKITCDFHFFSEMIHKNGANIDKKYNQKTIGCKRGQMTNMLFYESVTKNFPNIFDVINADTVHIDKTIIPQFEKDVKFFESEFVKELNKFYKKSVHIKYNINKNTLQRYEFRPQSNNSAACSAWMTSRTCMNQIHDTVHKLFRKHNLTRTIINCTWSRTAFYTKRKYFMSRIDPVKTEFDSLLPYPMNTPFVYTFPLSEPKRMLVSHVVSIDALDQPFVRNKKLINRIRTYIRDPTDHNFLMYSMAYNDIIEREQYAYNEQIINNFPIYALPFDIDIYDKQFQHDYFDTGCSDIIGGHEDLCSKNAKTKNVLIKKKLFLKKKLIKLVLRTFEIVGLKNVTEKNTDFFLFESIPNMDEKIVKMGFRLIVRMSNHVLMNKNVAANIIKVANFLMELDPYFPGKCIDEDIFEKKNHYLRLPLNGKRTPSGDLIRPLIPIIDSNKAGCCIRPSTGLVHHANRKLKDSVSIVECAPNLDGCSITQSILDSSIARRMIENKKKTIRIITEDYTKEIVEHVLPAVKLEIKRIFPSSNYDDQLFVDRRGQSNAYCLGEKLIGICIKKTHTEERTNPCFIMCYINHNSSDNDNRNRGHKKAIDCAIVVKANCYIYCYGTSCNSSFLLSLDLPSTSRDNLMNVSHPTITS